MEVISNLIKCNNCEKIMQKPVILPCGHSICKHHEDVVRNNKEKAICLTCSSIFEIPPNGLIPNKALEELIEKKIQSLDLGEEYNLAANKFQEFNDLLENITDLKNSSEEKIHSTISDLRTRIDLTREQLKSKIDEEALKLIKKLDDYEKECKESLRSINKELEEKISSWESHSKTWKEKLGTFERDVEKWKTVFDESTLEMDNLSLEYKNFKRRLFMKRLHQYSSLDLIVNNDIDMIK